MGSLGGDCPVPGGAAGFLRQQVVTASRSLLEESAGVRDGSSLERETTCVTVECGGQHAVRILGSGYHPNIIEDLFDMCCGVSVGV